MRLLLTNLKWARDGITENFFFWSQNLRIRFILPQSFGAVNSSGDHKGTLS